MSCSTTHYYIVRHAEKETTPTMMSGDVPLSAEGKQRAEALKDLLLNKKIGSIYSTNYIRTKATAQPLAAAKNISIQVYKAGDTAFIHSIRNVTIDVLLVGHSNTVDDLVNTLTGTTYIAGDLPETQYGDLFIVKRKGKKYSFEKKHFGK